MIFKDLLPYAMSCWALYTYYYNCYHVVIVHHVCFPLLWPIYIHHESFPIFKPMNLLPGLWLDISVFAPLAPKYRPLQTLNMLAYRCCSMCFSHGNSSTIPKYIQFLVTWASLGKFEMVYLFIVWHPVVSEWDPKETAIKGTSSFGIEQSSHTEHLVPNTYQLPSASGLVSSPLLVELSLSLTLFGVWIRTDFSSAGYSVGFWMRRHLF